MLNFCLTMQIEALKADFDALQKRLGDPGLSSIYGAGCLKNPDICFVFMNPTGKNVSADPNWTGLRAPWIGTKNVWKLFSQLELIPKELFDEIQHRHSSEWDSAFALLVYQTLAGRRLYVTNLSKSTQRDARPLPDAVFREYLPAFFQEIHTIQPKCIVTFGNQVSSILLTRPIKVSDTRKTAIPLNIKETSYSVYPTFYPVGQGMRNIGKAVEDIRWIINHE